MILQSMQDILSIVFLIIAILLLFLANYLATWGIESKTLAKRKKGQCFFVALIGLFMFIIVYQGWLYIISFIPELISNPRWPNTTYLPILGPIIVFLIYIVLVHWLIDVSWKNCVWISLLALLLLALFLTFTPYIGDFLNFGIF
ncbi:MAG: hypothetical protein ACFFCS_12305 [Candidatus Hodarchaeota archaeon]